MILGALINLGVDEEYLKKELKKIQISGFELHVSKVEKNHITGTDVLVKVFDIQKSRDISDINSLIENSTLSEDVKNLSKKIFFKLAEAESKVHNIDIEKVHFHEVGAIDSIVDIVGAAICIKKINLSNIYCSPLPLGKGFTKCSHGKIPIPAPATVEILKNIPVYFTDIPHELVTPTGAAIITSIAKKFGSMPMIKIEKIGYGAGKKEMDHPNFLRVFSGNSKDKYDSDSTTIIETNIDDMNPEIFGYLVEKLYKKGALDVFVTHIQMKKNRPGVKLSVISSHEKINELADIIFKETSTLGIRFYETKRLKLKIEKNIVQTKYGSVSVKIGLKEGKILTVSPEYEDCRKIADEHNLTLKSIYDLVKRKIKNN
jgi:uncharacterized protein (TIGR00299 family) protein